MANSTPQICLPCGGGIRDGRGKQTLKAGLWSDNPIPIQILGICSALAITTHLENSLVMGAALVFVLVAGAEGRGSEQNAAQPRRDALPHPCLW